MMEDVTPPEPTSPIDQQISFANLESGLSGIIGNFYDKMSVAEQAESLKKELAKQRELFTTVQTQLDASRNEVTMLEYMTRMEEDELNELRSKNDELQTNIRNFTERAIRAESRCMELQTQILALRQELQSTKKEAVTFKSSINNLIQSQMAQLHALQNAYNW